MLITDFNKLTVEEIEQVNSSARISFLINDGKIAGAERSVADENRH